MDDEEKAVIDSFEGKEAYEETYAKRDFYITDGNVNNNLLMLNAASWRRIQTKKPLQD